MSDITQIKVSGTTYTIKDSNALTSHPTITQSSNTTSTASPSSGSTFTVIDSITKDSNGHVTKYNTKTVTMPTVSSSSEGTKDYSDLTNKPSINGVTLSGNKTSANLGLASSSHTHSEYLEEPSSEGTSGQVLMTDGNGGRSWGSVTVDSTLTQSGKAADAKVTGDVFIVIKNILQKAAFTEDVSSLFTQLENLLSGSSESGITQSDSVLTVISGVTVSQSGTVLTLS